MYKLSIQQKVKEISQSTERNEIFFDRNHNSKSPAQNNEESDIETKFKEGQFIKASELLSHVQSNDESDIETKFKRGEFVKASELLQIKGESFESNEDTRLKVKHEVDDALSLSSLTEFTRSSEIQVKRETNRIDLTSEDEDTLKNTNDIAGITVKQENTDLEEVAETTVKEEKIDPEEFAQITVKQEKINREEPSEIKVEQIEQGAEDMDIDCMDDEAGQTNTSDTEPGRAGAETTESSMSVVTISCSTIKPLQGSPSGDSPKASILQTLKRPSISKDVQKIIAKREKHPPKSEYDIPSLPPLPSLTDSYNKTTFTAKKPDSVPIKEVKHEQQSISPILSQGSSNISPGLQTGASIKQESSKTVPQVTSSDIQPTFSSAIQSSSSTSLRPGGTLPQTVSLVNSARVTYTNTQSGPPYSINSVNVSSVQPGSNTRDFSPVFSLGTSSSVGAPTTSFQGALRTNTSNIQTNYSSSVSSTYSTGIHQGFQTAHARFIPPPYPASYPPGVQPTPGIPSVPLDPRLYHGISQPQNGSVITPSSMYFQHNHRLSFPMNINGTITPGMQVRVPLSSQGGIPASNTQCNLHSTSNISKTSSKTETVKSHLRSTGSKVAEKSKTNKKDCADIIVRYLTPYYRSGEVESKSLFKTLAKEMTERLVQTMGGVSNDKLRNTARSLVKVYFDDKRRKSSKAK
ncbi:Hypothetical predicted protein [Paramuricea clavata]|nr:Hypothetical predicted protein [Paramuricea clavata]